MTTLEERFLPHTNGDSNNNEAQQCAQICEEVALEFAGWKENRYIRVSENPDRYWELDLAMASDMNYRPPVEETKTTADLFTLFLNQKQQHGK